MMMMMMMSGGTEDNGKISGMVNNGKAWSFFKVRTTDHHQ